jgi:chromosomal replication initiation ATPase DnaA
MRNVDAPPTRNGGAAACRVIHALRVRDLLELVEEVCKARGVVVLDLCGRTRTQSVSRARQEAWWRIRRHPERHYSLPEIVRLFDRDHATVRAGIDAHQQRLDLAHGAS